MEVTIHVADERHAQFSLGDYGAAVDAYERGLELDASNANMKASLAQAKKKRDESSPTYDDRSTSQAPPAAGGMPDLAGLASMMGGLGGGGGGGMPDIAAMMRNPQMMEMCVAPVHPPKSIVVRSKRC